MKHFMAEPLRVLSKHLSLWHQVMRDRNVLETAKNRSLVAGAAFCIAFLFVFGRLADVMILRSLWEPSDSAIPHAGVASIKAGSRADILDRNGEILATHLVTGSVYANPKVIINAQEAAAKLSGLIPELDYQSVLKKLSSGKKGFVWIVRHISPKLQQEVNHLGIPGVYLQKDERRVYPYGALVSHVLGYCGIDNIGLAGVEKRFNESLLNGNPLVLSIDMRVQHIVHDELSKSIQEFDAEGGSAMVMEVKTGQLLAMVSHPDYNPNLPNVNQVSATFNRNTLGTYESGSTFKIFNTAIALETGIASLSSRYDNSSPIRVGRFFIKDFRAPKVGLLNVQEVFMNSSNIGSAKMALQFGAAVQQKFMGKFGLLKPPTLEIPEIGTPLLPKVWRPETTMTVAYGYGISVIPLQLLNAVSGIINDGWFRPATLVKRDPESLPAPVRILSAKTSAKMRDLMRLVVTDGTARRADIPGYEVFGKTGSAHKLQGRGYADKAKVTSFIGGFPKSNPQYIVLLFLDNPKPTKQTHGFSTGGWNATPTAGRIIARMGPLLGVTPVETGEAKVSQMNLTPVTHVEDILDDVD
jgi:cell division protein FtsI (penicillin-binding protein 3)